MGDPIKSFLDFLNPDSFKVATAQAEPSLLEAVPGTPIQFERVGYFCADSRNSKPGAPVFNRTVTLKDSWAKTAAQG